MINGLSGLLLATTFYIVASRRVEAQIRTIGVQAVLLAVLCAWVGQKTGSWHLWVAALLTAAVKAVVLPIVLLHVTRKLDVKWEGALHLSIPASLQASIVLALMAYYVAGRLAPGAGALERATLPVALACLFIGLFLMISRRLALLQVIGLLVVENSLFLTALGTTGGMPLVVEMGIAFDVLVAGIILGVLTHRIGVTFDSLDTEELRLLKD